MAEVGKPGALVAHEGDQGGDDDGQVVGGECRELVAEALAAAGGHDDERVAAVEGGLDGFALAGAEGGEAEQGEEGLGGRLVSGSSGRGAGRVAFSSGGGGRRSRFELRR